MKVAVTSQGRQIAAQVDPRFGRAKYFLLVDTDTGECTAHDNAQNVQAVQGAGIQAARKVIELGAEALITGNVGPKALAALQGGNVPAHIGASGSVQDAVEQFKSGRLQSADRANVEGHWT